MGGEACQVTAIYQSLFKHYLQQEQKQMHRNPGRDVSPGVGSFRRKLFTQKH